MAQNPDHVSSEAMKKLKKLHMHQGVRSFRATPPSLVHPAALVEGVGPPGDPDARALHVASPLLPFAVRLGGQQEAAMLRGLGVRKRVGGLEVLRGVCRLGARPNLG